jgi:hypothetical protein
MCGFAARVPSGRVSERHLVHVIGRPACSVAATTLAPCWTGVDAENLCYLGRCLRNAVGLVRCPALLGPVLAWPEVG